MQCRLSCAHNCELYSIQCVTFSVCLWLLCSDTIMELICRNLHFKVEFTIGV